MGIYIKGLTKENWDNLTIEEIEENYKVIEIKTPHGDLIDREEVEVMHYTDADGEHIETNAPIIIAAEGE